MYLTKEDVASNKVAGKFTTGNVVTLCDETMVRNSDNHQFSQVKMQGTELEGSKPVGEEILYINKSSKLLVTYEINEYSRKHFYNYYVLQNEILNLIKKVPEDKLH